MAAGDDEARTTPALVFCFNREECWTVAEQLKGKRILSGGQQERLAAELERYDWSRGAGPKLKQLLLRGVGVHHAGVLPKYRRIVEELFQRKAALRRHLHRDAVGGHQPAGPLGRRAQHHEGPAGQEEAARSEHGPPDFRPRRASAVRRSRATSSSWPTKTT